MAEFTIRPYGDPVLRAVGEPVREFGPPLRTLGAVSYTHLTLPTKRIV